MEAKIRVGRVRCAKGERRDELREPDRPAWLDGEGGWTW